MRSAGTDELVVLDRDHPGFRDPVYRQRRNEIARLAHAYRVGDPLPEVNYTPEEHGVWRTVIQHLTPLHARLACREFQESWPIAALPTARVPTFSEVNAMLQRTTGIRLYPAAGLITPRSFLTSLGDGIFWATQYLRHPSAPLYTPEPDAIHELIGHAALLSHSRFAQLHRYFGAAAQAATDEQLEQLIRVYWWTVEFGLVKDRGTIRAIGAGLLSSAGELGRVEKMPEQKAFSIEAAAATPYNPTDYQPVLFVAQSSDAFFGELEEWLIPIGRGARSA